MKQKLSVLEKVGYSLGDLSANLVFQTLMTYLAYFYTDVYGLKPEVATPIIFSVGMVAAFAFNPIIGALADRTVSRWGKFRPWIYGRSAKYCGSFGVYHARFRRKRQNHLCCSYLCFTFVFVCG
jgi:Na+/melibiose symporter-like transporter